MSATRMTDNFRYVLGGIVATEKTICGRGFHEIDPARLSADSSAGMARSYYVQWAGSEGAHPVEDMVSRDSLHTVVITVTYPSEIRLDALNRLVLSDRHDMIKALRSGDSLLGIDGSSSMDVGIRDRDMIRDSMTRTSSSTVEYRQTWRVLVEEAE